MGKGEAMAADQFGREAAAAKGRPAKRLPTWVKWASVAIVLVTTIGVPVALFESQSDALVESLIDWTNRRPLITALVLVVALTSDVLFPVPNGVINTAAGSLFGWTLGAAVIWAGLTIGCLLGYGVGRAAGWPLARRFIGERDMAAAQEAAERLGAVALLLAAWLGYRAVGVWRGRVP